MINDQQTNTYSKSTIETLEKGVKKCKIFKINNKDTRTTSMALFWYLCS